MAISINRTVEWQAGPGTPVKYSFNFTGTSDMLSRTDSTATFNLIGTATISNHPNNSQNSFAASDFAVLSAADKNPADYNFTPGTSYYQQAIPFLPNAPQSYVDAVLVEFRGDTYRPNPNASSLYIVGAGVVANAITAEGTYQYAVNTTFTITLNGQHDQPVLAWIQSGASSSTDYAWLDREVWATLMDYDYRPGETYNSGDTTWYSHNRNAGWAGIWNGSSFAEMRTENGDGSVGGNPPYIYNGSSWANQRKIGTGA